MSRHRPMAAFVTLGTLVVLTVGILDAQSAVPAADDREALGGTWELNRDLSQLFDTSGGDTAPGPGGGEPGGGGRVRVGRGGGGGGVRVGGPGGAVVGGGAARGGDPDQMEAIVSYVQMLNEPSARLTIVVRASSVDITNADGRTETLQTDNKKIDGRAGNGLVKLSRRARWDGRTLVSEIDIDEGPRIRREYQMSAEVTALHIRTDTSGAFGRRIGRGDDAGPARVLVYERAEPQRHEPGEPG